MSKECGVYALQNVINKKSYVGGSTNLVGRKRQHFSDLRLNKHRNPKLQKDFLEFGEEAFKFFVLENVKNRINLLDREQYWIDLLVPEYNAEQKAGCAVSHVNEVDVREKISKSVKQLWSDPEYRKRRKSSYIWKAGHPPNLGKKFPKETRDKISEAMSGENNPNYGKPRSRGFLDKVVKTYDGAISPSGEVFAPIVHLRRFCKEHGLDSGGMSKLLNGKSESYKGWKRLENENATTYPEARK